MLAVGAIDDAIAQWGLIRPFFDGWIVPRKRIVGVSGAGHLMVTELCELKNSQGESILDVGRSVGVCGVESVASLYDCRPEHIPVPLQQEIVNYVTAAALEETLRCVDHSAAIAEATARYPQIGELTQIP